MALLLPVHVAAGSRATHVMVYDCPVTGLTALIWRGVGLGGPLAPYASRTCSRRMGRIEGATTDVLSWRHTAGSAACQRAALELVRPELDFMRLGNGS